MNAEGAARPGGSSVNRSFTSTEFAPVFGCWMVHFAEFRRIWVLISSLGTHNFIGTFNLIHTPIAEDGQKESHFYFSRD